MGVGATCRPNRDSRCYAPGKNDGNLRPLDPTVINLRTRLTTVGYVDFQIPGKIRLLTTEVMKVRFTGTICTTFGDFSVSPKQETDFNGNSYLCKVDRNKKLKECLCCMVLSCLFLRCSPGCNGHHL